MAWSSKTVMDVVDGPGAGIGQLNVRRLEARDDMCAYFKDLAQAFAR
jgi:hypothetical protein